MKKIISWLVGFANKLKVKIRYLVDWVNKKIDKYIVFSFTILIIILCLILYFTLSESGFSRIINLLIPIITVISVYIVYLSIDVIREGNKFNRGQPIFEYYKKKIDEHEKRGDDRVFPKRLADELRKIIHCDVSGVTYRDFELPLSIALFDLRMNTRYSELLKKAEDGVKIEGEEVREVNLFINGLQNLRSKVGRIVSFYRSINFLYWQIFNSDDLDKVHKQNLFLLLNDFCLPYLRLSERILGKESKFEDIINMKTFLLYYSTGELSDIRRLFDDEFVQPFKEIEEVKELLADS